MQNLSRRGLHGTALEYAKLLLGLDPSDPRGVLFCIDYLAIRAHQYKFLKVWIAQAINAVCSLSFIQHYAEIVSSQKVRSAHS